MAEGGAGSSDPVGPGGWTLHLDEPAPCDGRDGHLLSASLRRRASLAILASAILALVVGIGQFAHFGVYAITFCVIFWITAGYSISVEADTIVVRRFGFTRRIPLSGSARSSVTSTATDHLRLLDRSGKRVSVSRGSSARTSSPRATCATGWIVPMSHGGRGLGRSSRQTMD